MYVLPALGSAIGSLRVASGEDPESRSVGVLAASGCAVMYPGAASSLKPVGPFTSAGGQASLPSGINYLEIAATGASTNASKVRVPLTRSECCRISAYKNNVFIFG